MKRDAKFRTTFGMSPQPVAGITLLDRGGGEPSFQEILEQLSRSDVQEKQKEELLAKLDERIAKLRGTNGEKPSKEPNPKRYVVDSETGKIDIDEEEGEYTRKDALLLSASIKGTGGVQTSAPEKLSELLTALGPYLNKGSDVDALKEILADKLALQRQDILSHIPPQVQTAQPKTLIEQITEAVAAMSSLKEAGPTLKSILGIPETSANSNPLSGVPVTVTGPDGKPAIMDFTQALDFRKFMAEERRADQSHETRMDVAKGFKDMLGKLGTAASHMAEGEEE